MNYQVACENGGQKCGGHANCCFQPRDSFISESKIIAKLQYGMKITFIFILILFIDSVNRVYRVQVELGGLESKGPNP